jgi:short-subunit dehydrogenase
MSEKELKNEEEKKVIIVTGGTSGIGEACTELFASKNYQVYSLSRHPKESTKITYLSCDITQKCDREEAIKKIILQTGRIDCLINNAGMGISGAMEYQDSLDIETIVNVNLIGTIEMTKLVLPYLKKTKGKIINIGSIAGELAIPFQTMYSVTKSAIHSFTMSLANEVRPLKIKVSCVMPGDTKTGFTAARKKENKSNDYEERITKSVTRMEKDETNGDTPQKVAEVIYRVFQKKNPPVKVAVDKKYAFLLFVKRFLSNRLINWILYQMYAK